MRNPDELARELAALIDWDEPPGMAASVLAHQVVELVKDREPVQAALITDHIAELAEKFPRPMFPTSQPRGPGARGPGARGPGGRG